LETISLATESLKKYIYVSLGFSLSVVIESGQPTVDRQSDDDDDDDEHDALVMSTVLTITQHFAYWPHCNSVFGVWLIMIMLMIVASDTHQPHKQTRPTLPLRGCATKPSNRNSP